VIRPGIFIKHKRYRDVCIRVSKAGWYDDRLKGRGMFWNLGYESSWPIMCPTKFDVSLAELSQWEWAPAGCKGCLRNAPWRSFS
jgi:hypothetical protein